MEAAKAFPNPPNTREWNTSAKCMVEAVDNLLDLMEDERVPRTVWRAVNRLQMERDVLNGLRNRLDAVTRANYDR
jgi:uncharacterized protein (UPF0147 family)